MPPHRRRDHGQRYRVYDFVRGCYFDIGDDVIQTAMWIVENKKQAEEKANAGAIRDEHAVPKM